MLKKCITFLLCFTVILNFFTLVSVASGVDNKEDVELLLGEAVFDKTELNNAVFLNTSGVQLDSSREYSKVTVTGEQVAGNSVVFSCDFDKSSGIYEFLGWFNGATLVSDNTSISFKYGAFSSLTPKILSKNVLTNASSFENLNSGSVKVNITDTSNNEYMYRNGKYYKTKTGPAPSSDLWGMFTNDNYPTHRLVDEQYVQIENAPKNGSYCGDTYFAIEAVKGSFTHTYYTDYDANPSQTDTVQVVPHSGNTMLSLQQLWRTNIKKLEGLEANTEYVLSFWAYQQNKSGFLSNVIVATNYEGLKTNVLTPYSDDCKILGVTTISNPVFGQWTQIEVKFKTDDSGSAYLHISQSGKDNNGALSAVFIDDLAVTMVESEKISGKELFESGKVLTQGVVELRDGSVLLNYTASALDFALNCEGTVKLGINTGNYDNTHCLRMKLFVDGKEKEQIVITEKGKQEIILADKLDSGIHTFKVERISESSIGEIEITDLTVAGSLCETDDNRKLQIDYFGDGITVGYGAAENVANPECDSCYVDGTATYAALTAKNLNANYNVFAFSKIGLAVSGYNDGQEYKTMQSIFASLPKNKNADVVVVNLGTYDAAEYSNSGLTKEKVLEAYSNFAKELRKYYTESEIVFAYGMMNDNADEFVLHAKNTLVDMGDKKVSAVKLPKGKSGNDGYPDYREHEAAALVLTNHINKLSETVAGDVNGDKEVNLEDVIAVAKRASGWDVNVDETIVDVNSDGKVDLFDAVTLSRYISNWQDIRVQGDVYTIFTSNEKNFKEIEDKLKLNSRATFDGDNLRMEWTSSGFTIEGQFSGDVFLTDVKIDGTNAANGRAMYYIVIDGDRSSAKQVILTSASEVKIAENIVPGFHSIQLFKATEASMSRVVAKGIKFNGVLFDRPAEKELKIQFIGDSITSSNGLYTNEEQPDAFLRCNGFIGYAARVAEHFDADLAMVSVSGGSVCSNSSILPDYYQKTFFSKSDKFDFSSETQPDIVVISLGTNDTPTYLDSSTGQPKDNIDVLKNGITDMLKMVRKNNPNATILWAYGMMATQLSDVYKGTVEAFAQSDGNTYYTFVNRNNCDGSSGHPSPEGHAKNAKEFISFIERNILNQN